MATGDFFYQKNSNSSSNYLKHLSEEREKNKKTKEEPSYQTQWTLSSGGTLSNINYGSITSTTSTGNYTVTSSNNNTLYSYPYYSSTVPITTVGYTTTITGSYGGNYIITPVPMLFENDIIKIKEGKVYINDKLEMNPTRIGLALLKALESFRKEDLNDAKEMFSKD